MRPAAVQAVVEMRPRAPGTDVGDALADIADICPTVSYSGVAVVVAAAAVVAVAADVVVAAAAVVDVFPDDAAGDDDDDDGADADDEPWPRARDRTADSPAVSQPKDSSPHPNALRVY